MTRLTKQKEKLDELLCGINPINAKSRVAELNAILDKYIPGIEQMHSTLKKYKVTFTDTVKENKTLKQDNAKLSKSLAEAQRESILKKLADAQLRRDYEEAVALLQRIPKEVLDELNKRTDKKEFLR